MATLEGTLVTGVYARVMLHVSGADDRAVERTPKALVMTVAGGRKVTVTLADDVEVRPAREHAAAWGELKAHPVHPDGEYHKDGHVRMRGTWLVPGDHICVIGDITGEDFVPDTGGEREAPDTEASAIRAVAIGAGEHAAADAQDAADRRDKALAAAARKRARAPGTIQRIVAIGFALAAASLLGLEVAAGAGTLGAALSVALCSVLFYWWASPALQAFPGGARDDDGDDDNGPDMYSIITSALALPCAAFFLFTSDRWGRNSAGCLGLLLAGGFPVYGAVSALLMKPRAVRGAQTMLPADPARRRFVVTALVVVYGAALAITIAGAALGAAQ